MGDKRDGDRAMGRIANVSGADMGSCENTPNVTSILFESDNSRTSDRVTSPFALVRSRFDHASVS
jgi:hypothetical protein